MFLHEKGATNENAPLLLSSFTIFAKKLCVSEEYLLK